MYVQLILCRHMLYWYHFYLNHHRGIRLKIPSGMYATGKDFYCREICPLKRARNASSSKGEKLVTDS